MNILFTILAAFPIGFFVRHRVIAVTAYLAAAALILTWQTLNVLLTWMAAEGGIGGEKAFGPFPTGFPIQYESSEVVAYGVVNLVIVLVGIGLTLLGTRVAARRSARKDVVKVD